MIKLKGAGETLPLTTMEVNWEDLVQLQREVDCLEGVIVIIVNRWVGARTLSYFLEITPKTGPTTIQAISVWTSRSLCHTYTDKVPTLTDLYSLILLNDPHN